MANKLADVLPQKEEIFPGKERIKSEELLGKTFTIKEVRELIGEEGNYHVVLLELDGKELTTAIGSKVVNDKIKQIPQDKFPVEVKMSEVKSKSSGRMYYDIEWTPI